MNEKFKLLRNPDRIVLSDVFHSIKVEKVSLCGVGVKCSYLEGSPKKNIISNVRCEVRFSSQLRPGPGRCQVCTKGRRGISKINTVLVN